MVNFSLEGKTALVTGASRGIGQALALALATSGAFVICASSRSGGCDETLRKIQSEGGQAMALDADLADADAVIKLAEDALSIKGHIDILLNNGGTIFRAPATDFPFDEWRNVLAVNIDSAFLLSPNYWQDDGRTGTRQNHQYCINVKLYRWHHRSCLHRE